MIPEEKKQLVSKALTSAFGTDVYDDIQLLTKGLSSALVFRIGVAGHYYLLRIITRSDAMGDPSFYYGCMQAAADSGIAPRVYYLGIEDRISITGFVEERPFSVDKAKAELPRLLARLHALPKFPFRSNYFERMEGLVTKFCNAGIVPAAEVEGLMSVYGRIAAVYPMHDIGEWVSSHNDSKPDNIVFDGVRPWLVDWESAFLNDRYLDLAIVANFTVLNEQDELNFLEVYFSRAANEYQRARFFLMQQLLHFYYFVFLMVFDTGEKPVDTSTAPGRSFRDFHNALWDGEVTITITETKREYALLHLQHFRMNTQTSRFENSLQVVAAAGSGMQ